MQHIDSVYISIGDGVFVPGGNANSQPHEVTEIFDLKTLTWRRVADTPQHVSATAVAYDGKGTVFVLGGMCTGVFPLINSKILTYITHLPMNNILGQLNLGSQKLKTDLTHLRYSMSHPRCQ